MTYTINMTHTDKVPLSLDNVHVNYRTRGGNVQAVRGVTLDLIGGESLALIGESGSGKTTLGLAIVKLLVDTAVVAPGVITYRRNGTEVDVTKLKGNVCEVELDDGTMLKADAVNVEGVGSRTTISLRPERVEMYPDKKLENQIEGTIREVLYLGDHLRVVMSVAGNPEFIVKVRNRGERWQLAEGQKQKIGWAASDCKALDPVA